MRLPPLLFASALGLTLAGSAGAVTPYVVLQDDGTIEKGKFDTLAHGKAIEKKLLTLYAAAGQPLPEILSVWTTFPFSGSTIGTIFDPIGLDVKGIGIEAFYPPDGTITSIKPPLLSQVVAPMLSVPLVTRAVPLLSQVPPTASVPPLACSSPVLTQFVPVTVMVPLPALIVP